MGQSDSVEGGSNCASEHETLCKSNSCLNMLEVEQNNLTVENCIIDICCPFNKEMRLRFDQSATVAVSVYVNLCTFTLCCHLTPSLFLFLL